MFFACFFACSLHVFGMVGLRLFLSETRILMRVFCVFFCMFLAWLNHARKNQILVHVFLHVLFMVSQKKT